MNDIPVWQQRSPILPTNVTKEVLWKDAKLDIWKAFWAKLCVVQKEIKNLQLDGELLILRKILYKHHNQKKRSKSFQLLKKAEHLCRRFTELDLFECLDQYQQVLNKLCKKNVVISHKLTIPTEEFTCFIIERILGGSKLIPQIVDLLKDAFRYFEADLNFGFFVTFNVFCISAMSKMWAEMKIAKNILTEVYGDCINLCQDMQYYSSWFPKTLHSWLEPDTISKKFQKRMEKDECIDARNIRNLSQKNGMVMKASHLKIDFGAPFSPDNGTQLLRNEVSSSEIMLKANKVRKNEEVTHSIHNDNDFGVTLLKGRKRKRESKLMCKLCGKRIRTSTPSLNTVLWKRHKVLKRFKATKDVDLKQIKCQITNLKHRLIHSRSYSETALYTYYLNCVGRSFRKIKKRKRVHPK